jgi:hypothetical protein
MARMNKEPDDSTSLAIIPVIISASGIDFFTFASLDPGATLNVCVNREVKMHSKNEKRFPMENWNISRYSSGV